ncbi:MAG: N(4)-(beta-N-acetylglucosaminyl)-L-asparaginase [Phycisphaerae bacterium]
MSADISRRGFVQAATATAAGLALGGALVAAAEDTATTGRKAGPIAIASANGLVAVGRAMERLHGGADPLDAAIAGVNLVEDDPNDHTVGLGGLPNEDGVVELDSSVMHGPTHRAGAVASLRNIRNPSRVAQQVMLRTDHVLLVGEGALRFARAHGFIEQELLTDDSRRIWLDWKERHSDKDAWLPPASQPTTAPHADANSRYDWRRHFTTGTINLLTLSAGGDLAGCTTTSGLAFKLPGRVGDSPIVGAGLYVDNAVGAAGSTGRGEANLLNCSSYSIVEQMRSGVEPLAACLEQLRRVAARCEPRLRDAAGQPAFDLKFYALRKDGVFASACLWGTGREKFAIHDGQSARLAPMTPLYQRAAAR